jgi:NADH:ubiquinone oxidoreductase subunit 5 (subunit L)/multisubunit Na+/H+ antiporter MnhA subunit
MIMECGLGAYGLAIFHLIAHGLFKGTIFLNCGYVIHAARQEPRLPPKPTAEESGEFSNLTWLTGFVTTLVLPLIIILAAHGILRIPMQDSQGTVIFLFFGWATSSQAILTLYRLRAVASWKIALAMLATLSVVVLTYLLAAESFTHFLFPAPGEVARNFRAGALPVAVFDSLVTAFALVIVLGWALIYAANHGKTIHTPAWVDALRVRFYLLLVNRLYLDALSARLQEIVTPAIHRLNGARSFPFAAAVIALIFAGSAAGYMPELSPARIVWLFVAALLLPLFPLHGLYVVGLTRSSGPASTVLALLLPMAGLFALAQTSAGVPVETLRALGALAVCGALYGSLKALAEVRVADLMAYASLAFYSALWWNFAVIGKMPIASIAYVVAVALLTAGVIAAWQRLQRRYGNLTLDRMHGLARPMPRFAAVFAVLVMAFVGLPPFGLFFSHIQMLLQPEMAILPGLVVIVLTWLLASWYLFRMMQRLLFGPHRVDLRYHDLRTRELGYFIALLVLLAALGVAPFAALDSRLMIDVGRIYLETTLWRR